MNIIDELVAEIHKNNLLSAGLIITMAGSLFYSLRTVPLMLLNKIIDLMMFQVYMDQRDVIYELFDEWLCTNYSSNIRKIEAKLGTTDYENMPRGNHEKKSSSVKQLNNLSIMIVWYKLWPIFILRNREKNEGSKDIYSMYLSSYTIRSPFGKKRILKLLADLAEVHYNSNFTDLRIYNHDSYSNFSHTTLKSIKPLDKIIIERSIRNKLMTNVEAWMQKEDFYRSIHVPYKLGIVLHGPPGNGKSTLVYSLAKWLKRHVYKIDMSNMCISNGLTAAFLNIPPKSVVLFEDIDSYFDISNSRTITNSHLDFSSLLNVLDGLTYLDSCIVIMTTNHIERLDMALIRAGRMDLKIKIGYPQAKEINEYVSMFYGEDFSLSIDNNDSLSMVDIQTICMVNSDSNQAISQIKHDLA